MDVLFFSLQYHQIQYFPSKAIFAIRRIIQLVCFLQQVQHQVLDSLVVSISACHVEGPGSIPGRGEHFLCKWGGSSECVGNMWPKKTLAIRGIEPVTFALLARRSNQLS